MISNFKFQILNSKNNAGFTIAELIIAIAVLSFGIILIYGAFYMSFSATLNAGPRFIAAYLNQEGQELIRNIRDYNSLNPAVTWTTTQPGSGPEPWYPVASSADGKKIIIGALNGGLYRSSNSGESWTPTYPSGAPGNQYWVTAASSADGSHLIVATQAWDDISRMYISQESGVDGSWTEIDPTQGGVPDWSVVAISADGTRLVAGDWNGNGLWTADFDTAYLGGAWTQVRSGDIWVGLASNYNGTKLVAGTNSRLYYSLNSGADWTETRPAGNVDRSWAAIAASYDGTKVIAGSNGSGGRLYLSTDSGANWEPTDPAGNIDKNWAAVASDYDGVNLVAAVNGENAVNGGGLYISSDSGESWDEIQPDVNVNAHWGAVASTSDGSRFIADVYNGSVYLINTDNWSLGLTGSPCDAGCKVDYKAQNYQQLFPYIDTEVLGLNGDGFYSYEVGGVSTIFKRKITISPVAGTSDTLKVNVLVTWTYKNQSFSLNSNEYLYKR